MLVRVLPVYQDGRGSTEHEAAQAHARAGRLASICVLAALLANVIAALTIALVPAEDDDRLILAGALICTATLIALLAATALHDGFWRLRARRRQDAEPPPPEPPA